MQRLGMRLRSTPTWLFCVFPCLLLGWPVSGALAQTPSNQLPASLNAIGIQQRLDESVPLTLPFRDEAGRQVQLGDYFGAKPVLLSLAYYDCPMLCPLVLDGIVRSLRAVSFDVGHQFSVITVSFDPRDTPARAAATKQAYLQRYGRPGAAAGWHFLTGQETSIRQLTQAVGFGYAYDPAQGQYRHASGIMLLTPQAKLARYFYGIEFAPRDIRLGLVEAAAGRIGSPIDQILLFCYHYDPATGQYGLLILKTLRVAGLATGLGLGTFMFLMLRRERHKNSGCDLPADG